MLSRRTAIKGLASIVIGVPALFGGNYDSLCYAQQQEGQVKQEDVFGTYEEFMEAVKDKKQENTYLRKLKYAHDNPETTIQLFGESKKRAFNHLRNYFFKHESFMIMDPTLGYLADAFALKEGIGVKFHIDHKNPDIADLVAIAILADDLDDFRFKNKKNEPLLNNIGRRSAELHKFQNPYEFRQRYGPPSPTIDLSPSAPQADPTQPGNVPRGPNLGPPPIPDRH